MSPLALIGQNCDGNLNVTIPGSVTGDTLQVDYSAVHIYCPDDETGEIDVIVSGGNPEYNYTWSNGNNDEDQYSLAPGTYTVTVTDAADCINVELIDIIVMDPVSNNLDLINVDACGSCTLEDGNQSFFYFDDMFIANIEDLAENEDLGPTTVCSNIYGAINYCEEEPCLPRSWTVETGDSPAQLTLYFTDEEFQELIDASDCQSISDCIMSGDLCITGFSGGLQNCDDHTSSYEYSLANAGFNITSDDPMSGIWSISFTINNSLISTVSEPTTYYLHTCKADISTVPLDLMAFQASKLENVNRLNWQTANEINFLHFEIERSENAIHFNTIGIIDSKNQINQIQDYQFDDIQPIAGLNYYRLKMVDQDGTFRYSHVVLLNRFQNNIINIFPNPFINKLNVNVAHQSNNTLKLYLYNGHSQMVYKDIISTDKNNQLITLDLEHLASGIYHIILLDFETGQIVSKEKLVKFKY